MSGGAATICKGIIHCSFGQYSALIGASMWLVFILMLMYGLSTGKAVFVLAHLIACVS